jgi:mTERF domain-containing protein
MLRLRNCIRTLIFSSSAVSPIQSPLHRLISIAAPGVFSSPGFAVEDYLVGTCGLTRSQALKAFPKLSHLKPPSKPDAVLAFLANLGLSSADVAAVVAKDPRFLCAKVERTLAPIVADLTGLGLSHSEVARLVSLVPVSFRCRSIVSNIRYLILLFGSCENLLRGIKRGSHLASCDLDNAVKPNVTFLRECGLAACDIAKLCITEPRVLLANPERFQVIVACAEDLGVPRGSEMFSYAVQAVACLSKEKIAARLEYLKNRFSWSDAEVRIAVCKNPKVLKISKETLQRKSEFLISEVGLEPAYIAHRPVMLAYSLEGRIRPRYYVFKFLKEKGLLRCDRDYYSALMISEKTFVEKFVCPHKEAAPYLAEDYAAACRGEVPIRFRFP